MTLDITALILVLLGAWGGWSSGSLTQAARLALLVIAAIAARALTAPIAGFYLRMSEGATVETAVGACFLGAFVALAAILWVALRGFTADLGNSVDRSPADRFAGAIVGAAKGAAVALILAVGLLSFARGGGSNLVGWEQSRAGSVAMKRDFLQPVADSVVAAERSAERPVLRGFERQGGE